VELQEESKEGVDEAPSLAPHDPGNFQLPDDGLPRMVSPLYSPFAESVYSPVSPAMTPTTSSAYSPYDSDAYLTSTSFANASPQYYLSEQFGATPAVSPQYPTFQTPKSPLPSYSHDADEEYSVDTV
jgi:hypothetical protein